MADETTKTPGQGEEDEIDLLTKLKNEIKDLKETTVPKEKYEKLKKAYVEGSGSSTEEKEPTAEEKFKAFQEAVTRVSENKGNNLEQAKDILYCRNYIADTSGREAFLPDGGEPDAKDITDAEHVFDILQQSIERADGDPDVFNQAFGSRIVDNPKIKIDKYI